VQEGLLAVQEISQVASLPMPDLTPESEFSGDLLRRIRLARGFELEEIAERTKISKTYLRAIEEENYLATPAPAYLRGFVKVMARELRIDPEQVARTYMERYGAARSDPT